MKRLGELYHDGVDLIGKLFSRPGFPYQALRVNAVVGNDVQFTQYRVSEAGLTDAWPFRASFSEASSYVSDNGRYSR